MNKDRVDENERYSFENDLINDPFIIDELNKLDCKS
jgi:hypothetical protein